MPNVAHPLLQPQLRLIKICNFYKKFREINFTKFFVKLISRKITYSFRTLSKWEMGQITSRCHDFSSTQRNGPGNNNTRGYYSGAVNIWILMQYNPFRSIQWCVEHVQMKMPLKWCLWNTCTNNVMAELNSILKKLNLPC